MMSELRKKYVMHLGWLLMFIKYGLIVVIAALIPFKVNTGVFIVCTWTSLTLAFDAAILGNLARLTKGFDRTVLDIIGIDESQLRRFLKVTALLRTTRTIAVFAIVLVLFGDKMTFKQFLNFSITALFMDAAIRFALNLKHPFVKPDIQDIDDLQSVAAMADPYRVGSPAWHAREFSERNDPSRLGSPAWTSRYISELAPPKPVESAFPRY